MNTPKGKYAWTVKVGEKGQFVIPKEARDIFGFHPGDTLIVLGFWAELQFRPKACSQKSQSLFSRKTQCKRRNNRGGIVCT